MVFKYTAIDENGAKERNVITADSMEDAGRMLRERNKKVVKIESVQSSIIESPNFQIEERHPLEKALCRFLISSSQIEIALGQIAVMLESGVPILNTLQIVASQSSFFLSRALFCVANKLQSGKQLKDLFHDEMPFLGRVIIGLISAGEANGDIDKMCSYSVDLLERSRKLKAQVMQALSYPVIVILATFGIVYFLMTKVIPKIMEFLTNRSGELPKITKALVDCTEFIKLNGTYLVGVPIVAIIAVILLRKNEVSAFYLDYLFLRMPIFGKVFRSSNNMLWCRTFGALLNSGIGILPALEYSREAVSNEFYRHEIDLMKNLISQGHFLSTALRVSELKRFIPMADAMLVVGENTGRIDAGLLKMAEISDLDLQKRIAFLSKMIEPVLFVVVGGIVGFVYIAFFMGMVAVSGG